MAQYSYMQFLCNKPYHDIYILQFLRRSKEYYLEDHLPNSTHDFDRSMVVVKLMMFFI